MRQKDPKIVVCERLGTDSKLPKCTLCKNDHHVEEGGLLRPLLWK